uniref:ATP-dependent RNA helicase DHX29 n=1 Tax=Gouania willdenowi TaxID=441366 RepID=A0A8C5EDD9_GOUWI
MGGKKKKSSAQAAAPVPSARTDTAAAGVEEEKPGSSKASKQSKAPKTYSLANTGQVDTSGVSDKSILKVAIQADLEKKIIKLINDFRQQNGDKGPISGRLTTKKLLDLYTALEKFKFKREHVEEAMKSSVLYGGDLHSALDWLCLNLKDAELPDGFSQQMQEESQKGRPRFQPLPPPPPPQEKPAVQNPKQTNSTNKKPNNATEKDEALSMKDWILRYAEQSSDDEEEEEWRKEPRNSEEEEKFDPNDRYLILTAQLYDAKEMATAAKTKGDKIGQRTVQDRIRIIQQEMKQLESHPVFNEALKVSDVPQKEKKVQPVPDKEELGFKLFEQAEKKPPPEKVVKKNEPKDIRNLDYTARSWTGKSPKQFLIDWVRKNLPKSPAPSFNKVAAGRYWRCKVRVQRTDDFLEVCPTILTEDSMQAQHLAATLALYNLVKGQSVHQLLPPTYRDVWLEWRDGEQQRREENRTAANKPRDQFISRLLTKLKQQQQSSQGQSSESEGERGPSKADDDEEEEPEESWESLAALDIREKGDDVEDKSQRRDGRKEKTGALEAARELLKKQRKSTLAQKLKSSLCGYQIRMENQSGDWTRLLYCTTGVLLRKLQQDRFLSSLTHIIVDEVHERSVQSDFLLTILKDVVMKRSDLQLILMSATVDCHKFSNYFNRCPVINIPGRTFPVEVFHLEDIVEETGYVLEKDSEYSQKILEEEEEVSIAVTQKGGKMSQHQEFILKDSSSGWDLGPDLDHFSSRTRHVLQYMNPNKINMELLVELIDYLDKAQQFVDVDGAVLVFLPGLAHIQQLYDLILSDKRFRAKSRYRIIPLHSTLSSKDQAAAFTVPPAGIRKIVLSTNIAETGVTIPDVVFVIDTGKTKENKYHESSQMSSLVETFVSKASALQRQGRAGRVRNGFCFRLYPKFRFDAFMDYSVPEILRVPLEELCLHIMKCQYGSPEEFLSRALDAPQPQSVSNAVSLLRRIGACHPDNHVLTPLGHHLAALPVNVKIGKMLIYGAILGCLEPIATIAAAITEKSPFSTPMSRKEEANLAKAALAVANSDHITLYNAYLGWKKAQVEGSRADMSYCRKNFLNRTALITIDDVKHELMKMMEQAGFCSSSRPKQQQQVPVSLSKQQISVLNAALTAGLYDSVARVLCTPSVDVLERVACTVETPQGKAQVHPSSVNRNLQTHGWLLYQEKVKYTKIYLRDTTLISPFPMLLFGGDIDIQHRERLITVDGWIHFQAPVRIGVIFKHLRKLMDSLLEKKLENPRMNLEGETTIQMILDLIRSESAA